MAHCDTRVAEACAPDASDSQQAQRERAEREAWLDAFERSHPLSTPEAAAPHEEPAWPVSPAGAHLQDVFDVRAAARAQRFADTGGVAGFVELAPPPAAGTSTALFPPARRIFVSLCCALPGERLAEAVLQDAGTWCVRARDVPRTFTARELFSVCLGMTLAWKVQAPTAHAVTAAFAASVRDFLALTCTGWSRDTARSAWGELMACVYDAWRAVPHTPDVPDADALPMWTALLLVQRTSGLLFQLLHTRAPPREAQEDASDAVRHVYASGDRPVDAVAAHTPLCALRMRALTRTLDVLYARGTWATVAEALRQKAGAPARGGARAAKARFVDTLLLIYFVHRRRLPAAHTLRDVRDHMALVVRTLARVRDAKVAPVLTFALVARTRITDGLELAALLPVMEQFAMAGLDLYGHEAYVDGAAQYVALMRVHMCAIVDAVYG